MNDVVTYETKGKVGLIRIANPPVNALGQAVRQGLQESLKQGLADSEVQALVVIGSGRTFPAGADITEFGKPPEKPDLPDVVAQMEAADKLIIAAIHGTALGGGMEVALGCDYRIALESARMGLPEVNLGLLPGAGGTQRLPRLVGAQKALEFIVNGKPTKAAKLAELGVVDKLVDGDLEAEAIKYAEALIEQGASLRPINQMQVGKADAQIFTDFEKSIARKKRGFLAPFKCIEAVKAAAELSFTDGMKKERDLFAELIQSPESAAQRHVFFAERAVAKVPGLAKDTAVREINKVAVIGAGTMGGGITMNFLSAGIPVTMLEMKQEALDRGTRIMRKNYDATARKGRITQAQVDANMARLSTTLDYNDLADADLIIEAVFENMDVKKQVFAELDKVAKPGAILASNTSTLDVNEIAAATKRPADVLGTHFFSPANVMKLLEVVRGDQTADDVLKTVMSLGKRIGKVAVAVGVCDGFVGNRILHKRQSVAVELVNQGATPAQVDKVLFDFGMPMGPFAMGDLAGIDVGWRIREGLRETDPENAPEHDWTDALPEMGRLGQKTNAGFFDYDEGSRVPKPSQVTLKEIEKYRAEKGITPREISDEEILVRCNAIMVNEAAKILEEGIAARALDVDIVWIYGYGFPVYRGGLLFWADQAGVKDIHEKVAAIYAESGDSKWKPAKLLTQLAAEGKSFADVTGVKKRV